MNILPVILSGHFIRLEPTSLTHVSGLTLAGQDESIWRYLPYGDLTTENNMREFINDLLTKQEFGTDLPFTVVDLHSGNPIGCTRYLEIRLAHRSLEIGGTWYSTKYQGSSVNTECKYLMLKHAFETLNCIRVQFKTDVRNARSQRALERVGAVKEGLFRNHFILPNGEIRHSIYYSIIDDEWPEVKLLLENKLSNYR